MNPVICLAWLRRSKLQLQWFLLLPKHHPSSPFLTQLLPNFLIYSTKYFYSVRILFYCNIYHLFVIRFLFVSFSFGYSLFVFRIFVYLSFDSPFIQVFKYKFIRSSNDLPYLDITSSFEHSYNHLVSIGLTDESEIYSVNETFLSLRISINCQRNSIQTILLIVFA